MKQSLFYNLFFIITSTNICFSQVIQNSELTTEFGVTRNTFAMTKFNQDIVDYYIHEIERLEEHVNEGYQLSFGLKFKTRNAFSFGFQFIRSHANTDYMAKANFFQGSELIQIDWYTKMRTEAFQLNSTLNYNTLSLFKNSGITKNGIVHFSFGPELSLGYGIAHFSSYTDVPWLDLNTRNLFKANGLTFQTGFFTEFCINKFLIYGVGLRAGYQFFQTSTLKLHSGDEIIGFGDSPPNLDFSGFYYGIYLKFGK